LPQVRAEPLDYDEPQRSRTGIYAAVLVLLIAALAVVLLFLGNSLGWWHLGKTTTPTFALPSVAGETVSQAKHTLQQKGLDVVTSKDAASSASTNDVVSTDPPAGTKVRKGQTITLVTGGKTPTKQLTVPRDLVGESVQSAQNELASMGLQPKVQMSATCNQQNIVCSTSPAGGASIGSGGIVTLVTAQMTTTTTTPSTITVPNVAGLSVTQACNRINQAMLTCGSSTSTEFSSFPSGEVASTSPPAGTGASPTATVNLIVSEGQPPTVPGVVGDTFGQAKSTLESDGLAGVSDGSCSGDSYSVVGQTPGAGSSAPNNGEVTLSCSAPSPTTTTTTTAVIGPGHGPGEVGGGSPGASATTMADEKGSQELRTA
ncbi:MAG: PASTA domain-containing protein, partial [Acidimicrobiales bacterium]